MTFENLSDLIDHKKGFAFKSSDYQKKGTPVVRVSNFTDNSISTEDLRYVKHYIAKSNRDVALKNDDIIIATVGSWPNNPNSIVGKTVRVPIALENSLLNQNSVFLRVKTADRVDQIYLYYCLKTPRFSEYLISNAQGSANQASITLRDIFAYQVEWKSKSQRETIANILDSLDKKIALNNQINQTLESMIQAIFKSWFIDFDPVHAKVKAREDGEMEMEVNHAAMRVIGSLSETDLESLKINDPNSYASLYETACHFPDSFIESKLGKIPMGWKVSNLSSLIDFNPRRLLAKGVCAPYLGMAEVPTVGHRISGFIYRQMVNGSRFSNGDTLLARITPSLENGKTAYVDFLNNGEIGWGSTEFIVMRPKTDIPSSIGYLIARLPRFRKEAILSMTGTSGRQRADIKALENINWIIPPLNILKHFGHLSDSYIDLAKKQCIENETLITLRDTLIPRLLSGEIDLEKSYTKNNENNN